jgi:hypothetical protein
MAVWFAGLVLLDGAFLAGASKITDPPWIAAMLAISAIVFVPLFLAGVFLMQTRFRSHLQEDKYYAEWLKRQEEPQSQAITAQPLTPQAAPQPLGLQPADLSPAAAKILRTLWKYQKQTFQDDYSKRWLFGINPLVLDYASFLSGVSELIPRGLVAVSPENHLCMLTNEGIAYVQQKPDLQAGDDFYHF